VRFLHLMVSALQTLEAIFQNVTQPITAISPVSSLAEDVMFALSYLSCVALKTRWRSRRAGKGKCMSLAAVT
jgi:hypothetical protein